MRKKANEAQRGALSRAYYDLDQINQKYGEVLSSNSKIIETIGLTDKGFVTLANAAAEGVSLDGLLKKNR